MIKKVLIVSVFVLIAGSFAYSIAITKFPSSQRKETSVQSVQDNTGQEAKECCPVKADPSSCSY